MGVFLSVGVLLGLFVAWRKAREAHIEDKFFLDTAFMALFWGLVGARVGYIITHFGEFGFSLLRWLWVTNYVGLCWWGGLLGGVVYLIWKLRREGKEVFLWLDYLSLGLAAALPWGFLAVFLNGSYMGVETGAWWGMVFPGYGQGKVPVQPVMLIVHALFFWWWWRMESQYRMLAWYRAGRVAARTGFLWFGWLIFAGLSFALASLVRAGQTWIFGVSLDMVMGTTAVLAGVMGLYYRSGRRFWDDVGGLRNVLMVKRTVGRQALKKRAGSVDWRTWRR